MLPAVKSLGYISAFHTVILHFKIKDMRIIKGLILPLVFITILASCKAEKQEDLTNEINKNGSVETAVSVSKLDSLNDILITKHTVWFKGNKFKEIEYRDTVPALGIEQKTAENSEGDKKTVEVKKDYEIFITVK